MRHLGIGELARTVSMRASTLRFWEQIGLLPVAQRERTTRTCRLSCRRWSQPRYNLGMIPQQWRDDPAFAQALHPYVDAKLRGPMPHTVVDLATALPPDDARAVLLHGLETWRPYAAARTLVEWYADDEHVRTALQVTPKQIVTGPLVCGLCDQAFAPVERKS
ncbi:MerR family DNA-binding transcriptional regulator [Acrocarpospora sp. B8E8]|uniref:MerR family transcriptional regulator n=1 Tax=Acrocarpospora sp. B8E8 TaxID=3153572 RepID=UPI00325E2DE5